MSSAEERKEIAGFWDEAALTYHEEALKRFPEEHPLRVLSEGMIEALRHIRGQLEAAEAQLAECYLLLGASPVPASKEEE